VTPARRPLAVTTRAHPMAVVVLVGCVVLAVLFLTGVATARALTALTSSPGFADLWASGLGVGGAVALAGALVRRGRLATALLTEAAGSLTLALALVTYAAALVVDLWGDAIPWVTVTLAATVALGCAARAVQCVVETRRALAAARVAAPADPPPLGEARRHER